MSHRLYQIGHKPGACRTNEDTGRIRHAALTGFVGLTFAIWHATAIADAARPESDPQVEVSFVLQQLSADEYSSALPALSTDDLELLLAGEPVIKLPQESEADTNDEISEFGIFGLKIVDAPRLLVWSTVMGAASEPPARLTRAYLSRLPNGSYIRYQHINLPWPIKDRHWVIVCEKNLSLADSSNGLIWQHRWALHEDGPQLVLDAHSQGYIEGLSQEDLEKSVYIPANRGAWTLADLGNEKTLVIGYFDAALGGLLPKMLVRTFTRRQMRAGLNLIEDLTNRVHLEYDGNPQIHDGYGRPIRPQDVLRLAGHGEDTVNLATDE